MRKSFKVFVILLLIAMFALMFAGCKLSAQDCYVFGEEEFVELRLEDNSLADSNALRIMSANLLVHFESWGGEPVKPRAHRFAEAVKHYMPDVIGAQEMCSDWYKYLMPQISDTYAVLEPKYSLFRENRTPIIYNKQKLKLVDIDLIKYSKGDNNACRVVTYGVFDTQDGKRFAVTSTHLDLIRMNDYDKEKSIMLTQVREFFDVIDSIKSKYNCPVLMTGDYNSMESETSRYLGQDSGEDYSVDKDLTYYKCYGKPCGAFAYQAICERYTDTKFIRGVEMQYANTRGYLYNDPTWDHIFVDDPTGIEALTFRVMASNYFHNNEDRTSRISDHLPIALDLLLK